MDTLPSARTPCPGTHMRKEFLALPPWDDLLLWGGLFFSALGFGLLLIYLLWHY